MQVKEKQIACIALINSKTNEEMEVNRVKYKAAKKIVEKVVYF